MVKIPSLDELKKMGSGLIDQAKAVKFGEMVDKVKSGIDSVGGKKTPDIKDVNLKSLFQELFTALNELASAQTSQVNAIKKIEKQLEALAKVVETYQPPIPSAPTSTTTTEEKPPNEK